MSRNIKFMHMWLRNRQKWEACGAFLFCLSCSIKCIKI